MASQSPIPDPTSQNPVSRAKPISKNEDFLTHLEVYLAKRDGVDKLLKISSYATKIILASSLLAQGPLHARLKSFESSVGVSCKAFLLGNFIHDVNALRKVDLTSHLQLNFVLAVIAHGGEGLNCFIEQFVWLGQAGLIDKRHMHTLQKWGAWCELAAHFASLSLNVMELMKIDEDERRSVSSIDVAGSKGTGCAEEQEKPSMLREKKMMKRLSVVQDLAGGLMALASIRDGRGLLSAPLLTSSVGLLSAVISTHKSWVSC